MLSFNYALYTLINVLSSNDFFSSSMQILAIIVDQIKSWLSLISYIFRNIFKFTNRCVILYENELSQVNFHETKLYHLLRDS